MKPTIILIILVFFGFGRINAQHEAHSTEQNSSNQHTGENHQTSGEKGKIAGQQKEIQPYQTEIQDQSLITHNGQADSHGDAHKEFDPKEAAFHHISDLNVYSIGPWNFPLPCILYAPGKGWEIMSSSVFHIDNAHHGTGHYAVNSYILNRGRVNRIVDPTFPQGTIRIGHIVPKTDMIDGKEKDVDYVEVNGKQYPLDKSSAADGGIFGGGITSFYDFSITKNVTGIFIIFILLTWAFVSMARRYKKEPGTAPKGGQLLFEPLILFVQDEVAKPIIGPKYEKYLGLLIALFFFILALNLFGQIPFLGGANVTGNLAVTMGLAFIAFIIVNVNGNKHYWEHILWMPGIPAWVKIILTPVEILGVFIKPLTLMLRLFANISAGHLVILVFLSLIFIFGKSGASPGAAYASSIASVLLALFIMAIELLVAFIQAYVFILLTASFIGSAIEEHHSPDSEHNHHA